MTAKKTLEEPAAMHTLKPVRSYRENRQGRKIVSLDGAVTAIRWLENVALRTPLAALMPGPCFNLGNETP